ncbi:MAG: glycosyltransferase [Sphingomonadales bacterium]|nr:MAG: glycosyltransferase [Sphingomonadales bacterium]
MRVAIHTLGTRGDVQPYLALARGLKSQGHDVLLAAPSQFEAFVGTRGIAFAHLPGEYLELMETSEAKAAITGSGGFTAGFKMLKHVKPVAKKQLAMEWAAAKAFNPELIVYHPKAVGVPHIAEKLKCLTVLASPLPGFTPTKEFASPMMPFRSLGPLNRATHSLMAGSGDTIFRGMIGDWRVKDLGLPRRPRSSLTPDATLYAFSSHVVPVPADWPASVDVTGYWFLEDDQAWSPSADLERFLADGRTPVYVGFGSMPGLDPVAMTKLVLDALAEAGERGVLATGGGAIHGDVSASHVHFIDGAPHDKLFPLVSACVHHGGAGTTAASLRAGKPTVICPFFGDQPFWAHRIEDLGVGPTSVNLKQLSSKSLAAAIHDAVDEPAYELRGAAVGRGIRSEDGVARAIAFLESRALLSRASAAA